MIRRPPKSTRTHTRCPATTLVRCELGGLEPLEGLLGRGDLELLALADQGAHHVGLAPLGDLLTDPLPDPRLLVLALRPRGDDALPAGRLLAQDRDVRSEEHTSELQSLMRISYAVFCLTKKNKKDYITKTHD